MDKIRNEHGRGSLKVDPVVCLLVIPSLIPLSGVNTGDYF